ILEAILSDNPRGGAALLDLLRLLTDWSGDLLQSGRRTEATAVSLRALKVYEGAPEIRPRLIPRPPKSSPASSYGGSFAPGVEGLRGCPPVDFAYNLARLGATLALQLRRCGRLSDAARVFPVAETVAETVGKTGVRDGLAEAARNHADVLRDAGR